MTVTGDDGRDVTPKSLFSGVLHDRASQIKLEEGNSSSIDFRSMASFFQTGMGTQAVSLFGQSVLGSQSKVLFIHFRHFYLKFSLTGDILVYDEIWSRTVNDELPNEFDGFGRL